MFAASKIFIFDNTTVRNKSLTCRLGWQQQYKNILYPDIHSTPPTPYLTILLYVLYKWEEPEDTWDLDLNVTAVLYVDAVS